jgi:hypothetical protein
MLEDLTVTTVDRAYGDGKRLQIQIRGPDDPRQYLLAEIEDLTVKKIQVPAEESANLEVVGLNIKAVGLKERI